LVIGQAGTEEEQGTYADFTSVRPTCVNAFVSGCTSSSLSPFRCHILL